MIKIKKTSAFETTIQLSPFDSTATVVVVVRGQPLPGEWTAHGAISLWATGTSMFGLGETSGYWPPDTELAAILLKKTYDSRGLCARMVCINRFLVLIFGGQTFRIRPIQ